MHKVLIMVINQLRIGPTTGLQALVPVLVFAYDVIVNVSQYYDCMISINPI